MAIPSVQPITHNCMQDGAPTTPATTTRPINIADKDKYLEFVKCENWPKLYSELHEKYPHLARVVSALDNLIPQAENETQNVLGFELKAIEQLRGYRKPSYTIATSTPSPNHSSPVQTRRTGNANVSSILHRVSSFFAGTSSNAQPTASPSNSDTSQPRSDNSLPSIDHAHLMPKLLKEALNHTANLEIETRGSGEAMNDLTESSANRILEHLMGEKTRATLAPAESTHQDLLKNHSLCTSTTILSSALRREALLTNPALADFYTAVGAALTIQEKNTTAIERFNVATEDYLTEATAEHSRNADNTAPLYFETFCPNISREIMEERDSTSFQISMDGAVVPIEDMSAVVDYVFNKAKQHLTANASIDRPAEHERFPLVVYKTLAKALNIEVPNYLIQHENNINLRTQNNLSAFEQKKAANQERIALAQAETKERKAERAIRDHRICEELQITDIRNFGQACGGAPANSAVNTAEYAHALTYNDADPELFYSIQGSLNNSRDHQQVAAVDRTLEDLRTGKQFYPANRCWLRAIWISLFEQIENAQDLDILKTKLPQHAQGRTAHWPVLFRAILDDYKSNRDELLHRGETSGFHRDAHFMAGRTNGEYLASKGISTDQFDAWWMSRSVEDSLRSAAQDLAMGMRGTEKPRFDQNVANLMGIAPLMNSEFVVAVHRVMEKPCFVVERSPSNQISVIFSGDKSDQDLKQISDELERVTANRQTTIDQLTPLFEKYKNIPIIMLNAEHYTVYLPRKVDEEPFSPPISPAHAQATQPTTETESNTFVTTTYNGQSYALKANHVDFGATGHAVIGQTPESQDESILNIAKLLDESSANGSATVFEYISPLARFAPEKSRHPGTVANLNFMLTESHRLQQPLQINGKTITNLQRMGSTNPEWIDHYQIEYFDPAMPGQTRFAYITQAAPDFSEKYLTAEQLNLSLHSLRRGDGWSNNKRYVLSAMGVGRSAALSVLDKANIAIQLGILAHPSQISSWLHEAKESGIRDRGRHFLAHPKQVEELHKAIYSLLVSRYQSE